MNNSINSGAGNDYVHSNGANATIIGGTDNDLIRLSSNAENNVIVFSVNDGNDTCIGFNETDTLKIGEDGKDVYYTQTSGDDIVVTVEDDKGKITLSDAATLEEAVNIEGTLAVKINTISNTTVRGTSDTLKLDTIYNHGHDVTISALGGNDTILNYGVAPSVTVSSYGSNISINAGNGDDSIYNYASYSVADGGTGNDYLYNVGDTVTIDAGTGNDSILSISSSMEVTINPGTGDDTVTFENVRSQLIRYTAGDGNDLIQGFKANSTLQIADGTGTYSSTKSGDNVIVTVGDGKVTLEGAASLEMLNIDGIFTVESINSTISNKLVTGTAYDDTIINNTTARTKAAIRIVGNAKDNSILGGSKNDTLYGKDDNDYLADSAGNDVIYDYAAGDVISLGAAISKSSFSGNNAILTIGSNKLTIKNGKGKELSLIESDGTARTIIGGASLLSDSSASKVTLKSSYAVADASARTAAIKLVGNALDNTILGGSGKDTLYGKDGNDYLVGNTGNDKLYGQNGADTLWGGTGNDTLIGGTGSDVFIYNNGDGKDVITDFIAKDDMLQITGEFSATYYKSSNKISFKVGSTASAITLKDISVTSATIFNINGDTYKISGTKLVKK